MTVCYTRKSLRAFLLPLLLPLLLVLGQQAAMRHELSHLGRHTERHDHKLPGQLVCEECAAFADVTGGAISAPYALAMVAATHRVSTELKAVAMAADRPASRNRGPPIFL